MHRVVILCYHAVSTTWSADLSIHPDRLEEQLRWLTSRGFRGATFTQAVLDPPHRKTLAVTFDDGFLSVLELGLPILERLELPGTVFAVSDFASDGAPLKWDGIDHWAGGPFDSELRSLSWEQLGQLIDRGWEIGSHTASHPRLTTLSPALLTEELTSSRQALETGLGHPAESIAYPYGDTDERVATAAREAGYRTGAGLPARVHRARQLDWPRIGVYNNDSLDRLRLKTSKPVRAARFLTRR
jgi:peptidoglycan/xylan/chitin deacetylase (PgdA/CDA1 family)